MQDQTTRLPAEWAPQSFIFLAWPFAAGDFGPWIKAVDSTYGRIAMEISQRQGVLIACRDEDHRAHIGRCLENFSVYRRHIRFVILAYQDTWVRDTAPISVVTPQGARLLDFGFNGWGNKYAHETDAGLARQLYRTGLLGQIPFEPVDVVLEGGSLETDGQGTLLATRRSILNPNRNPTLTCDEVEKTLKTCLGIQRIHWLEHGFLEGDDTDAHVDTLARFCTPCTIAYTACERPTDPHFEELKAMEIQLNSFRTVQGRPYQLVPLPIPEPLYDEDHQRLPANYANFLIINRAVLVPVYGDEADKIALARLTECFPNRKVVPIPCRPLIFQYGSLHCMTMQFPEPINLQIP